VLLSVVIAYLYTHLRPENGKRERRGSRGCPDLEREHAEKAMAILDAQTVPASSGIDTEEYRSEIRRSVQQTLKKLGEKQG